MTGVEDVKAAVFEGYERAAVVPGKDPQSFEIEARFPTSERFASEEIVSEALHEDGYRITSRERKRGGGIDWSVEATGGDE
jgi:hypothetical protein